MSSIISLATNVKDCIQYIGTYYTTEAPMSLDDEYAHEELYFVGFNQDASSIALGAPSGYALYSTSPIEKPTRIHESHEKSTDDRRKNSHVSEVILAERLFSSSLLMLVSMKAPRKLRIYHFNKNNEICSQNYPNTVLAVKLNRDYMAVCLEEMIYIHTVKDMKTCPLYSVKDFFRVVHSIQNTPPNNGGVIDLSANENSFLAYPGSVTHGHVHIFDVTRLDAVKQIAAHTNPLQALRFSWDGRKLATASTRGTVIRVFNTESGQRLFEFTRGVARFVTIYSMAFSRDGKYLCTSSNTETVHVFKLERTTDARNQAGSEEEQGWVDYFSKQASFYLPVQMNDLLSREKSFATAKLPAIGRRNVVAMPIINNKLHLIVLTTDGFMYIYVIENEGGELALVRQHKVGIRTMPIVHANDSADTPNSEAKNDTESGGSQVNSDEFPPLNHSTE